jgi:TorA maturation chaperone TorD
LNLGAAHDDTHLQLPEEERSRADCYALISCLFYAAPDAGLLASIAGSAGRAMQLNTAAAPPTMPVNVTASAYARAFSALRKIARVVVDAGSLRQEYDDLFVGAGKALITPYTAGYALPHAPDRHLLELREWLARRGLGRRDGVFELEDHISAICDVMRWLIEQDRAVEEQREFFDRFVRVGAVAFCTSIQALSNESCYGAVASLAQAFLAVEKEAFDLHAA